MSDPASAFGLAARLIVSLDGELADIVVRSLAISLTAGAFASLTGVSLGATVVSVGLG
jgi:ABC-type tungstate transport system substrate-binding protein